MAGVNAANTVSRAVRQIRGGVIQRCVYHTFNVARQRSGIVAAAARVHATALYTFVYAILSSLSSAIYNRLSYIIRVYVTPVLTSSLTYAHNTLAYIIQHLHSMCMYVHAVMRHYYDEIVHVMYVVARAAYVHTMYALQRAYACTVACIQYITTHITSLCVRVYDVCHATATHISSMYHIHIQPLLHSLYTYTTSTLHHVCVHVCDTVHSLYTHTTHNVCAVTAAVYSHLTSLLNHGARHASHAVTYTYNTLHMCTYSYITPCVHACVQYTSSFIHNRQHRMRAACAHIVHTVRACVEYVMSHIPALHTRIHSMLHILLTSSVLLYMIHVYTRTLTHSKMMVRHVKLSSMHVISTHIVPALRDIRVNSKAKVAAIISA